MAGRCRSRSAIRSSRQEIIKASGADILRLWVSMSDFTQEIRLGKEVLARSVEAYRKIRNTFRYLRREPLRLRSGRRSPADRSPRGDRSLHSRALRRARPADRQGVRRVRLRHGVSGAQRLCHGRSQRVLCRRFQGSALHVRRPVAAAAFRADGHVRDRRGPCASDGAHSAVHRRRALAVRSRHEGGIGSSRAVPCRSRAVRGWPTTGCWSDGPGCWRSAKQCWPRSNLCERASRSAARCRRRSCCPPPRRSSRCSSATRRIFRCSSSCPKWSCRRRRRRRRRGRAARHDRAGRWRQVRALLAVRERRLERPGLGRPVRAVPGRAVAGRSGGMMDRPARRPWRSRAAAIRRAAWRSGCRS